MKLSHYDFVLSCFHIIDIVVLHKFTNVNVNRSFEKNRKLCLYCNISLNHELV